MEGNIKSLREEMANLASERTAIEDAITLSKQEGKCPPPRVTEWLKQAQKIQYDVTTLLDESADERADYESKCALDCNLCYCYERSRIVAKKLDKVKQLLSSSCNFPDYVFATRSPIKAVEKMAVPSLVGQKAASDLSRLLELMNDDVTKRVAVWGMGGVGKTSLVKNLNNELFSSVAHSFDLVIWVQVSRDLDLQAIQQQIAERLNLELCAGESTRSRARKLLQRLIMTRKLLLIFDDVWDKIDLDTVGIPEGGDHPCCKILFTTQSSSVCREMGTDQCIKVDLLSQEDAWSLFAKSAGNVIEIEGIKSLAREVARECCFLPLAIKTLGKSMSGKSEVELWKNALCQMQRSLPFYKSIEDEIFLPLSMGYDSLHCNKLKQCFLFCSLYPENCSISVTELIQCWTADGLICENQTLEESFNNGVALIDILKESSLLALGEVTGTVKMHDVIRDVAIWLSQREEEFGFSSESEVSLHELPKKFQKYRRVSFLKKTMKKLPSRLLECSKLTVLLLQGNPLKDIPNEFFLELRELKVLNLSGTQITSLPASLLQLEELRALLLRDCRSLERLPPLGALYNLRVLDLSSTPIKELPKGMGNLRNLGDLNLSRTLHLETIEAGAISGLTGLENLDMSFSAYEWDCAAEESATYGELLTLERLSVLNIRLDRVDCLVSSSAWLKKLRSFSIQVGPRRCDAKQHPLPCDEKRVTLRGVDLLDGELEGLFSNASALDMVACGGTRGLSEVASQRQWYELASLKALTIEGCDWMTHLITSEVIQGSLLPNLEHLVLRRLENLRTILDGMAPKGCLGKLKTIEVEDCPRLRTVVTYGLLRRVQGLERIKASVCQRTRCIIKGGILDETLPRLKVIQVRCMVNLRTICSRASAWPELQRIEVCNCPMLARLHLSVCNSATITEIRGDSSWWNNLRWEDDKIKKKFEDRFRACPDSVSLAGKDICVRKLPQSSLPKNCLPPRLFSFDSDHFIVNSRAFLPQ
ncbi:hypothetical protein RJ639_020573 [Escallonia herrerae]|uniref:AAA+ ATPase domain-containing protein n=1 Tax=Escallonia herrerae TaxID=1293975 RepID=A0AA88V2L3_9ASTE|nr:hypothetical protein RJ639_020573 [Escallonia herrerae]